MRTYFPAFLLGLSAWLNQTQTTGSECTKDISKGDPQDPIKALSSRANQLVLNQQRLWELPAGDFYPFKEQEPVKLIFFSDLPFTLNTGKFLNISNFINAFYGGSWIAEDQTAMTYKYTLDPIGGDMLQPDAGEPVRNRQNPQWRMAEVWRVLNVFRMLLVFAQKKEDPRHPVAAFLDDQTDNALTRALFPDSVKDVLKNNEKLITEDMEWVGTQALQGRPTDVMPFGIPAIQVPFASYSSIGFYQRGGVGPLSIEAAFILATQLAGIDFQKMVQRYKGTGLWWTGSIVPPRRGQTKNSGSCMEQPAKGGGSRRFGFSYRPMSVKDTGDLGAGFFVALEVDGSKVKDTNRNIFLFAVHAIDPHSRIRIPDTAVLTNLRHSSYTPANGEGDAPYPGSEGAPYSSPTKTDSTYFVAHAHSTIMRYSDFEKFLTQSGDAGVDLPMYTQVGFNHIYIQSELDSDIWPRKGYVTNPTQRQCPSD